MKFSVRKFAFGSVAAITIALSVTGCFGNGGGGTAPQKNAAAKGLSESAQVNQYGQVQPIPQFPYSQYRKATTEIEAAQALGESGTAFFMQMGLPNPVFSCNMEGQPVPNTTQLSNPSSIQWNVQNSGDSSANAVAGVTIPQIDPNGVYTPTNSSGTYVLCRTNSGGTELTYWEGDVLSFLGPAKWNFTTHTAVVTGTPNMPSCSVKNVLVKGKNTPQTVCSK